MGTQSVKEKRPSFLQGAKKCKQKRPASSTSKNLGGRKLYDEFLRGKNRCVIMDDETYVIADFKQLPGRSFYKAFHRFGVARQFKYQSLTKFPKKYMVWQAICSCGKKSTSYVGKGTMKSSTYIKECLKKRLLPFIRSHSVSPLFWPDLASIHYSKEALE